MIENVALEFKLKRIKVDNQNIVLRYSFIWGSENGSLITLVSLIKIPWFGVRV
jgi:hypothetical protein